ncbi:PspC domain-containing protein [Candidatus Parcubacteria bacterium]|nr:PspC domain-containing protein [Candidatus Parcubacteria bacterium]
MKKLYRSEKNRIFAGVIGGIGEYLNIDPAILRITWLLIVVFTGFAPGIFVYIISAFVVPEKPSK